MKNKFKKLLAISLTTFSLSCAAFSMNVSAYGGSRNFSGKSVSGVATIDRTSSQAFAATSSSSTNVTKMHAGIIGIRTNGTRVSRFISQQSPGNIYVTVSTLPSAPFSSAHSDHYLQAPTEFLRIEMSA